MATPTPTPLRETLDELTDAVGRPMATIYLPLPSASEDAAQQFDIRRRNVPRQLLDAGADDALAAVAEHALTDRQHSDGAALLLVVDTGGVLVDRTLIRPVSREVLRIGPAPALLPALRAEQDDLDHAAVLLDRAGADVWVRSTLEHAEQTAEVEGDTEFIHRAQPGGWSQRRFQQRSENTWESNASEVVAELLELVDLDRLDRIVVAGDTRAVGFFTEHLPSKSKERLIVVEGSRHSDHDAFLDAADTAIRTAAKEHEVSDIRQLREELATDVAVEGLEVLSLLAEGRVERLFVVDDTESDERLQVPYTVEPLLAGPMAEEMSASERGPAADLAVLMAHRMGTAIHVLPSHGARLPAAGLAARLRG
jgi:hypothetical protein